MRPNRLGRFRVPQCKRFTFQTLLLSLEVVIHIILKHNTIADWDFPQSWSISTSLFRYLGGLTKPKCHRTKHKLVVWLKQANIDIWKFSPQNHISFYKVFFDKKHSKYIKIFFDKKQYICGKDSLRPPGPPLGRGRGLILCRPWKNMIN